MISYKLVEDSDDCDHFVERLLKYNQRGFNLLIPIKFCDDKLYQAINHRLEKLENHDDCKLHNDCQDDGLSHYCSFMLNNDTNRIRQQFINMLQSLY